MNWQKSLLICLILFIVCSFSAVSAADANVDNANNTLATSEGDVAGASNELSLSSSPDGDVLGTGGGSFKQLNDLINDPNLGANPIIDLGQNYTYDDSQDGNFKNGIIFTKGMTIDGHGYALDGNNLARILSIGYDGHTHSGTEGPLILKNIRFVNAFSDDTEPNQCFGAVAFYGKSGAESTLLIQNCTFLNNKAYNAAALSLGYSYDNLVNITNCTFESNIATGNGGGAIRLRSEVSNLKIKDTIFKSNKAPTDGAAIHISSGGEGTVIDNCTFISNAAASGAAVHSEKDNVVYKNSKFIHNNASADKGGAILATSPIQVLNCSFEDNFANVSGGAIYFTSGSARSIINNSNFTNNLASGGGGAIYRAQSTNNDCFDNCRFINNSAWGRGVASGGAIYWFGDNGVINNSYFKNNTCDYSGNAYGGGAIVFYYSRANTVVDNCTFEENYARAHGGAISAKDFIDILINNSRFIGNHAPSGGAMFFENAQDLSIFNCTFDKNYAVENNGRVESSTKGGAINFNSWDTNTFIKNCTFTSNTAGRGGAIRCDDNSHYLKLYNVTFKYNYARWEGAGFSHNYISDNAHFENCTFINCTTELSEISHMDCIGGGIYLHFRDSKVVNMKIINCSSQLGGAIGMKGSERCSFMNITIINCTASQNGGALKVLDVRNSVFGNATITNCSSTYKNSDSRYGGGAIHWSAVNGAISNINITNSGSNNGQGGAIHWSGSDGKMTNVNITNTESNNNGGAVYWTGSKGTITAVNINGSSSNNAQGGAIYMSGEGSTLTNVNITDSESGSNGGAICWTGANGIITTVNVNDSRSNAMGGAVYANANKVTISYSNFTACAANQSGGAIYFASQNGNINHCNFTNNSAIVNGGAIYVATGNQNIGYCTFDGNNATGNGGAIYVTKVSDVIIHNSTIKKSHAYNGGGVFYEGDSGASLFISNDTFIGNRASHNGGAVYYVVDNEGERVRVIYRDYNNFDNRRIIDPTTKRTTVTMQTSDGTPFANRIFESYFEDNEDYLLNVTAGPIVETVAGMVNISNPNDANRNKYRIVINVTRVVNNNEVLVAQVILNTTDNYTTYFTETYKKFVVPIMDNLTRNTEYNVTVGFEDSVYLYKEVRLNFTTSDVESVGDFHLLQWLIGNATDGGTINLQRPYKFMSKEDYPDLTIGDDWCVNITKPIIINGNGFSISGEGLSRIFNITGVNVTLNRIQFINGNASGKFGAKIDGGIDKGGAILWSGVNGTVVNSTFSDNRAEIGGGLYVNESALNNTITKCTFRQNTADTFGGAIDCNAPKMNLTDTIFESNYADTGAALCREKTATGGFGINNTFIRNHAGTNGSALAWMEAKNIYINNYTFINNTAGVSGGAIYVGKDSTNCTVAYSYFYGNNITSLTDGHGGAIEWYADTGNVINSTFISNNAPTGGAIYVGGESGHINITQSGFLRNHAIRVGGAIDLVASSVTVNNSYFRENTASNGGAIFVGGTGENNFINASYFTDNNATGGRGGAINWNASAGQIFDTNFTRNHADYGGAIYIGGNSDNSKIVNVKFTKNNATYNGGAIDWNATGGKLYNTTFISNYAGEYGAALCRESGATGGGGKNNTFISNHAGISGAALGWINVNKISIDNYTFIDNTADFSGGAIYIGAGSDNCNISNCTFRGNNITNDAGGHGGAVDIVADNATIKNSNFTNNNAFYGGAVFVGSASGNTHITNVTFRMNNANVDGGAINLQASGVNLNDTRFYSNTALRNGGGLYVGGEGTTNVIYNSTFEDNRAENNGGAVYWRAHAGHIAYSNFTNWNTAKNGGAIYLNGVSSNTNITHVIFRNNYAYKNGGAIDCNATRMNLTYTLFESNWADEYGAALCREKGATSGFGGYNNFTSNYAGIAGAALAWLGVENININHYRFTDNIAVQNGGAIYASVGSNNFTVNNCVFTGNNVTNNTAGHGGAIDIDSDNNTIKNSNFTNNNAFDGGALHIGSASGHTNITNVIFTKNGALNDGGAINMDASGVRLNDTKFYNNTAVKNGGALYVGGVGTTNTINNTLFDNNKAGSRGGAIDWLAKKGEITYSNFTKNSAESGGAIFLNGQSSESVLSHLIFENNAATKNGGAIDCNATLVNLTHTKFTLNTAEFGGALCRESGAKGGFGVNNTFDKNHATKSGAALAWLGVDNIKINNYTFTNNTADYSGGAIFVGPGSDNCQVYNCTFDENYISNAISGRGGAIDWIGNNGTVKNTTFNKCISINAGAIYVDSKSDNFTVKNVTFTECNSLTNGGALVLNGDNVTIDNSTFISCSSNDYGGAIAGFNSNNGNITDCFFKYNTVGIRISPQGVYYGEGGAIYWENSKNLTVKDSRFESNAAHLSGGSISADNCSDSVVCNITTHDETAFRNGGSVAWTNSNNVTIKNSTFNDSGANYKGGSVYFANVNATVNNTLINYTWASWDRGGGMYVDGNVTLNNVTFNDTHGDEDNATAIYFNSGISNIINSKFTNSFNSIGIAPKAKVTIKGTNLTADDPNKTLKYLEDNSTVGVEKTRYSIWNDGELYLEKNNFDYVIFNNGTITSKTYLDVLYNQTWNVTWNETFTFRANITDDNNNSIISVKSLKTWNNHDMGGTFNMSYNQRKLNTYFQDVFIIYGSDAGLANCVNRSGTIRVKMPVYLSLTADATDPDHVVITATLTPKYKSNHTITDKFVYFKLGSLTFSGSITSQYPKNWTISRSTWDSLNMAAGTHMVTAEFKEDDYHLGVENWTTFDVKLRESWIRVAIANINYGETATALITTNSNATVNFTFHGRNIVIPVTMTKNPTTGYYEGRVDTTVAEYLTTGMHDVDVVLAENEYYAFNTNRTSFEVRKLNTTVDAIRIAVIQVGDKQVITVTVHDTYAPKNPTGFVNIAIGGETHYKKLDANGQATLNIYDLAKGEYNNYEVDYEGDGIFNGNSTKVSFRVDGDDDYNITVKVNDVKVGENATIYIVLPISVSNNLTVYVNNTKYENVTVKDGLAIVNVNTTVLNNPGSYVVNVTYPGDSVYALKEDNGNRFNVNATDDWTLYLDVVARPYGENTVFTVTLPANVAVKKLNLTIDGKNYTVNIDNTGVGTLTLNNLSGGLHTVVANYTGDNRYVTKTNSTNFMVDKAASTITLTQNANGDVIATVLPTNVTGTVTFYVNERNYTVDLIGNVATLNKNNLTIGNNSIAAIYNGDVNFTSSKNSTKFPIAKNAALVNVTATNETYGRDSTITVKVPVAQKGYVTITVNDTLVNVTVKIENGEAKLDVGDLGVGRYIVNVTYLGDANYASEKNFTYFNITKATLAPVIVAQNVTVKDNASFVITVNDDFKGQVNITVNGIKHYEGDADSLISIRNLPAGTYTANITFYGDNNFTKKSELVDFEIYRVVPAINVTIDDVTYPGAAKAIVNISDYANGTVNITVGDKHFVDTITNGHVEIDLTGLSGGVKKAVVNFTTSDQYNFNGTQTVKFEVIKAASQVNVTQDGKSVVAKVTDGATGTVTFYVNGRNETKDVGTNGIARWDDVLLIGNNSVVVVYNGDVNFTVAQNSTKDFTIPKYDNAKVNVTGTNVTYGNASEITVKVPVAQTGYVNIIIVGTDINVTVPINKTGAAKFNATGLNVGEYRVNVIYLGDDLYDAKDNFTYINITKANLTASVVAQNATVKENVSFVVNVNSDFKGRVNITKDGVSYFDDDFKSLIVIDNIPVAGIYDVNMTFYGDANYNNRTVPVRFEVSRVVPIINVTIDDVTYPGAAKAIVNISDYANGTVNITIGDKHFTEPVTNGHVEIDLNGLSGGVKKAVVNFTTSDKYNFNGTQTVKFEVIKAPTTVNITQNGKDVNATVTPGATGTVTFIIDGKKYEREIINGNATLIGKLTNGNNTIVAIYNGDENYTSSLNVTNNTVDREIALVNVTASNVTYGNASEITVKVPVAQKGYVRIIVNETLIDVTVEIKQGVAKFNATGLDAGRYVVNVTYLGDETYAIRQNSTYFNITKANLNATVIAQNVTVNENASFVVSVNNDFEGDVKISIIGGTTHYDGELKSLIYVNKLPKGTYTANVTFYGDDNYNNKSILVDFNVSATEPTINVTIADATYPHDTSAIVKVSGYANGTVEIKVGENTYTRQIRNGEVTIPIIGLDAGLKEAFVKFTSTDDYNTNVNTTYKFFINQTDSHIDINVTPESGLQSGDNVILNITVSCTGDVIVYVDGKENKDVLSNNRIVLNKNDLSVGDHTVVVYYPGDVNYRSSSASHTFTVGKHDSLVNVTVDKTVSYNEIVEITVETPKAQTGYVTITVNNRNYTAKLKDGAAKFNVTGLKVDKYTVNVTYEGNENYTLKSNSTTFEVTQINLKATVIGVNVTDAMNSTFVVSVPDDYEGQLTITVDGETYTGNATSIIQMAKLTVGEKTAHVVFADDANYKGTAFDVTFNVTKSENALPVTTVVNSTTVVVTVPENVTGNVTVVLPNGTNKTVVIENGSAVITLENMTPGENNITVIYTDGNNTITSNATVTIPKYDTEMKVTVSESIAGGNATVTVEVPLNATGTITVTIDGKKYTTDNITAGKATLTIENLTAGNKTLIVEYSGNANYTANYTLKDFTVAPGKVESEIIVVDHGNGTVVVVIGDNATGNVTIKIGDKEFNATVVNGTAIVNVTNVTPGIHEVEVIYSGDANHTNASTTANITAPKYDSEIKVEISEVKAGETATVTVTVPQNATGNVTVTVDGKSYTTDNIIGGKAVITTDNLTAGPKTVVVEYSGDANYSANYTVENFTVSSGKVESEIIVVDHGNGTVVVVVGDNATGNVTIKVGDKEFNATVVNGTAIVNVTNVTPGIHEVEVIYSGDGNHTNATANANITAPKYDSEIKVEISEVEAGETATITVTVPQNATGNVTVTVDGKSYTTDNITGGKAIITTDNLTAGPKTVVVEYSGDGNYSANYTVENFTVSSGKVDSEIIVVDHQNGTVVVVVGDNATGNVTIKVGDKQFNGTVINGTAVVYVNNVTPGIHEVEVIYSGDANHTNATANANITAPKYDSQINVTVGQAKEGEPIVITVEVPIGATGDVVVNVGGENHTGTIDPVTGKAVVTVDNVSAGNHTIAVEYAGDGNYSANYTISNMTVEKAKVESDLTVVDYGNGTVVVVVGDNATGNVTIKVGDEKFNGTVINGTAVVYVNNVTPGVHEVEVVYSGDATHTNATTTANITAPKYDSQINVTVSEAKEGEPVIITVTVPANATGNVTVTVDGRTYTTDNITDGKAIITTENLTAGPKSVIVEYSGDGNYSANYTVQNFTVDAGKVDSEIIVVDHGNGTVVVVVGDNATGNVTIKVGDKLFNGTVINGTAVVYVNNVTPGIHEVEVIYSGDANHTNATANANITAPKYDSQMNITVSEAKEGEPIVITVEVPIGATGDVVVNVGGENHTGTIDPVTGKAVVTADNVSAGNHTIAVEYVGDGNYSANYTISSMTVEKAKVESDLTVVDYGNGTVVVVVGDNATGNVTIKVGDELFNGTVINGTAVVYVNNVTPGVHEVEVVYSGDATHTNATTTANITAPKYDSQINVTVGEAKEGEAIVITVEVPVGATGDVVVNVGGENHTGTIDPVTGKAVVTVDNVSAGSHTIAVEYSGDSNYAANYTISNMTVEKAKEITEITVVDHGNGTVVIVVGDNATGNVTVKVGNETYNATVINGTAVITLDNVTPGDHEIEIIYSGDDTHTNATANATITVSNVKTSITIDVSNINVGDKAIVKVTVDPKATGEITIEIDGVKYTRPVSEGTATFEVENLTAGEKSVFAVFNGGKDYRESHASAQFNVSKVKTAFNVTVKDAKVGENVTVTITLPDDATGQILIDIDGVGYYANVTDGVATANIPYLPSGTYDVNLTYTGDEKYVLSSNRTSVKVSKLESFVIPKAVNIVVGENEIIRLIVPSDATGNVTLVIDNEEYTFTLPNGALGATYVAGEKYTVAVSGGNGEITITGLPKGEYVVSVKYNGDHRYMPSTNTTIFTVSKIDTKMDIVDEGNGTIKVILPDDATGNVTVKVDNKTYTVPVENGTATVTLENTTPGVHDVEVKYTGDDNYLSKTENTTVDIPKYETPISVSVDDIYVGDIAVVTVTVPEDATGNVTIEINGVEYSSEISDGKAVFNVKNLAFGNKTVAVTYHGDNNHLENFTTGQFEVMKRPSTVSADSKDIKAGKTEVITVTVPGDATGRVLVNIDGVGYYGNVVNGKAKVIVPNLKAGSYTAAVTYEGDDKYLPSNTTTSFKVDKSAAPISATGDEIEVGEDAVVVIDLPSDATGTVTIRIDGKTFTTEVVDGMAVFVIPGLSVGIYPVDVHYSGDDNYPANDTVTYVIVNESPDGNDTNRSAHAGVELSDYPTANPILIALLAMLSIGSLRIRRFRK